jgi:hypothetical protein
VCRGASDERTHSRRHAVADRVEIPSASLRAGSSTAELLRFANQFLCSGCRVSGKASGPMHLGRRTAEGGCPYRSYC